MVYHHFPIKKRQCFWGIFETPAGQWYQIEQSVFSTSNLWEHAHGIGCPCIIAGLLSPSFQGEKSFVSWYKWLVVFNVQHFHGKNPIVCIKYWFMCIYIYLYIDIYIYIRMYIYMYMCICISICICIIMYMYMYMYKYIYIYTHICIYTSYTYYLLYTHEIKSHNFHKHWSPQRASRVGCRCCPQRRAAARCTDVGQPRAPGSCGMDGLILW